MYFAIDRHRICRHLSSNVALTADKSDHQLNTEHFLAKT